jgi:hypothetical protein
LICLQIRPIRIAPYQSQTPSANMVAPGGAMVIPVADLPARGADSCCITTVD